MKLPQSRFRTSAGWCSARVPGAAQHEAQRNDALQTRDRFSLRRSRISGASLHFVTRCTASGTHDRDRPIRHLLSHDIKQPSSFPRRVWAAEAPALASRRDAPQHEGRRATLLSMRAARSTNLWLCEMAAGSSSLFPACSLQGMMQLQRVGPPRPMWHHPRNPICHQSSS